MSDIFDSRDLLDELKTLDKEYDEERIEAIKELIEEVGEDNFEMGVSFIQIGYRGKNISLQLQIRLRLKAHTV